MGELPTANVGTWHLDMATGLFSVDQDARSMLGMMASEPTGLASLPIHDEDRSMVMQQLRDCLDSGTDQTVYFRTVAADGEVRQLRGVARRVEDKENGRRYLAGTIVDVSRHPSASTMSKASEEAERMTAQFRAFFESTSDCVYILDRDWRFTFLNQRAVAEIAEGRMLIGETIWDAFPKLSAVLQEHYREAMATREPRTFEAHYGRLDVWYEVHTIPLDSSMAVFFRNITARKASDARNELMLALADKLRQEDTQSSLEAVSQLIGHHFGCARAGYGYLDPVEEVFHHEICWTDGTVPPLSGPYPAKAFGEKVVETLARGETMVIEDLFDDPRSGDDMVTLDLAESVDTRAALGVPFMRRGHLRSLVYLNSREPRRWSAAEIALLEEVAERTRQVIERAEAEAALKSLNAKLEAKVAERTADRDRMWRLSTDLMLVARFSTKITAVNPAWTTLLGWSEDELLGRRFTELVHPDDSESTLGETEKLTQRLATLRFENRIRHKDGSYRWLSWTAVPDDRFIHAVARDITKRKHAEMALQESESLNRTLIETSTDCIKLMDLDGNLLFLNGPGQRAMEIDDFEQFRGKPWAAQWPSEAQPELLAALNIARSGGVGRFSAECATLRGTLKWWDVVITPCIGEDGQPTKLVGVSRDITQQKLVEDQVRWSATHDALTSLPNRALFQERLSQAIKNAQRRGRKVGLLHLDVDHFKQINDSLGHDAGDLLLQTFANRLQGVVRADDTVARLGGDEFAIILPGIANEQDVTLIVESLLTRMREPFVYAGRILDCRASIGASIYPQHGASPEELLKHADIALYVAKSAGRGGLMVFHSDMRSELQKRSSMITLARDAISDGRVIPFYQPKIDFLTNHIVGFEALLRWRHPRGGIQAPGAIAAAFEDLEVAAAISNRIVQRTIADMRRWLDRGIDFGHVAVNAAAAEFRNDNLAERVLEELHRAGVPARHFQLEVTETVFLGRGSEYVERALKLLSAEGVTIALDDFGTGYASLSHLKQFPVDVIKIDQSFVRDLEEDPDDAAIIRAVLRLGHSLGIKIVAEGIETKAQARYLRRLRCDYGQGHLFSKAVLAAKVPALLERWHLKQEQCLENAVSHIAFPTAAPEEFMPVAKATAW